MLLISRRKQPPGSSVSSIVYPRVNKKFENLVKRRWVERRKESGLWRSPLRFIICSHFLSFLISSPTSSGMKLPLICRDRTPLPSDFMPFLKKFTSREIERATDGFSMILGSDSHGTIYRARFPDGLSAAVKRRTAHFQQEKDAFYRELQLLGRLHHRHIVKLKGFSEGHCRLLVFDYIGNGSLKECLHDPLRTPLNWRTRLQIAIDVAAALEYLYYFCNPPVDNVSINSKDILLDEDFVAKLSDVGFRDSNLNHGSQCDTSQDHNNHQIARDVVFQFGVLILELVSGRSLGDEDELVQWVQESGFVYSMHKIVDADLGDSYDSRELRSLLIIARLCTRTQDEKLISIPQILRYLQGKVEPSAPSV